MGEHDLEHPDAMNADDSVIEPQSGMPMDEEQRRRYLEAMGIPVWLPRYQDDRLSINVDYEVQPHAIVAIPQPQPSPPDPVPTHSGTAAISALAAARAAITVTSKPNVKPGTHTDTHTNTNTNTNIASVEKPVTTIAISPGQYSQSPPTTATARPSPNVQYSPMPQIPQPTIAQQPPTPTMAPAMTGLDWDGLATQVAQCQACPELVANRSRTVLGVGNRQAQLLVIGEAPGADEDRQGEPFVGRAGQLLNAMLNAIGLQREEVYIANILKCRPPNNRNPLQDEAQRCEHWLLRQIELVQPRLILAVGAISAQNLLKTHTPVGQLRSRVHKYGEQCIPLIVTYHPAYLLRSPGQKAQAWKDMQAVAKFLRQS